MKTIMILILCCVLGLLIHKGVEAVGPGLISITSAPFDNYDGHNEKTFLGEGMTTPFRGPYADSAKKERALILQKIFFPLAGIATLMWILMALGLLRLVQNKLDE